MPWNLQRNIKITKNNVSFLDTETTLTRGSLHELHRDDTQSRTEWDMKITLFYGVTIQLERLRLQLFIKYPDTGKITCLFLKQ